MTRIALFSIIVCLIVICTSKAQAQTCNQTAPTCSNTCVNGTCDGTSLYCDPSYCDSANYSPCGCNLLRGSTGTASNYNCFGCASGEVCIKCPGGAVCNPDGNKYVYGGSVSYFYCAGNGVDRITLSLGLIASLFALVVLL